VDHSLVQRVPLTCPRCGRAFEGEIGLILDTSERPDLLERARDGTLHTVACPHCGHETEVDAPLLVLRPGATPPLLFSPAQRTTAEEDRKQAAGLVGALRERMGADWREEWLAQGLPGVPRPLLPAALSDDPEAALRQMAEQARREIERLREKDPEAYRQLKEAARQAMQRMPLVQTLQEFIQARTWAESRRILEAHPELLGDEADALLGQLVQGAQAQGDEDARRVLEQHRALLRRCREVGIEQAFAELGAGLPIPPEFQADPRLAQEDIKEAARARGIAIGGDVAQSTRDGNRVQVHLEHHLARPPAVVRYPDIACPERVSQETRRFQVVVRLGPAPNELSPVQEPLSLQAGEAVRLHLDAPDFELLGPPDQETVVLPNAPSPPVVFDLRPRPQTAGTFSLTLTFFQGTDLRGSVSWTVEVVEERAAERLRSLPVYSLHLEPPHASPERLLLIEYAALPTPRFRFQLVEGAVWHPAWELPLSADPGRLAEVLYRDLDLLREQADPVSRRRVLNLEGVLRRLKALGQRLWRELTPPPLQEHYAAHRTEWHDTSLLLYTAEPHIPWELVWPYGQGWEDEGPWAMTLDLARWLPAPSGNGHTPAPPSRLLLTAFGCLAPGGSGLPQEEREAQEVRRLLAGRGAADRTPPEITWPAVMDWLEGGGYDWVHIAAHGSFSPEAPDLHAALRLGDEVLTPAHLVGPRLEGHFRQVRPVWVVNACDGGRLGWAWTGMGGWAQRLVESGAGAFLAPMWAAGDDAARTFALRFYGLLEEATVARAVRLARQAVQEAHPGDPTYLAYSLYAHPNARVVWKNAQNG